MASVTLKRRKRSPEGFIVRYLPYGRSGLLGPEEDPRIYALCLRDLGDGFVDLQAFNIASSGTTLRKRIGHVGSAPEGFASWAWPQELADDPSFNPDPHDAP